MQSVIPSEPEKKGKFKIPDGVLFASVMLIFYFVAAYGIFYNEINAGIAELMGEKLPVPVKQKNTYTVTNTEILVEYKDQTKDTLKLSVDNNGHQGIQLDHGDLKYWRGNYSGSALVTIGSYVKKYTVLKAVNKTIEY